MTDLKKSEVEGPGRITVHGGEQGEVRGSEEGSNPSSETHQEHGSGRMGAAEGGRAEIPQAGESSKANESGVRWVLAPMVRRRPPSFTRKPGVGRARFLSDGNFVDFPQFAGNYAQDLLLPPGVGEQFKALKERLERERAEQEGEEPPPAGMNWKQVNAQEHAERVRLRKRQAAEKAAREEEQAREKMDAQLKRMGLNPDQGKFHKMLAKLPHTQRLQVYRPEDVQRLSASPQTVDSDVKKRGESLGYLLKARGPWRRLGLPESVEAILALEEDHPHFVEVIQFVANHVALQKMRIGSPENGGERATEAETKSATGKVRAGKGAGRLRSPGTNDAGATENQPPVRLPPMLLFGPPGVGKTHFCESLAKVLGVPVRRHPMDQAETSSALLGSDATWGNSRFGLVFDLLGLGDYANPLVILDELDKAQVIAKSSGGLSSPTGVLHSLLEPISAANVRDISLDLEMDASQITWIATANYPWWVPETLRSRFKEFLIAPPDARQAIQLARSVVKSALKAAGFGIGEPDRQFVLAVAHLSAREIYQATVSAAASAARDNAKAVGLMHLPRDAHQGEAGVEGAYTWLH